MKAFLSRLYRAIPLPLVRLALRVVNTGFNISVAGVFFTRDGRVLVLRHVYRHSYPWGLPSGFLSAGESPEQGLMRELKEETGLDGRAGKVLGVNQIHAHHVEVVISGTVDAAQPLRLCHEIFEAAFVDPTALPDDMPPSQKDFVRRAAAPPALSTQV